MKRIVDYLVLTFLLFLPASAVASPLIQSFRWDAGKTVAISATDSSGSTPVAITSPNHDLLISNTGTDLAWIECGSSTAITATKYTGLTLLGSSQLVVSGEAVTYCVAVMDTGKTATIYITPGIGR